eukprot:c20088_g1_i3.p1 GENE.c20088_g1_i3~~c20088_g1_i3.p1  ORF type:complete len:126 (+),score=52.18 c20088_g1_i3:65-442(+)
MVSDKFQVRAEGPINNLTHQPVKGRKAHGGIRLGEMERDALLGHGAAFILHDRLMNCSDFDTGVVCSKCGSVLASMPKNVSDNQKGWCQNCQSSLHCRWIQMPYVFKYLTHELASMNIKVQVHVQ